MFKRHFALTAGMILVSFVVLAIAFTTLSYQYSIRDQKDGLEEKSGYVAAMTAQVINRGEDQLQDDAFQYYLGAVARLVDTDVMLCDTEGTILFASNDGYEVPDWQGMTVPAEVLSALTESADYEGTSDLGVFGEERLVCGAPVTVEQGERSVLYGYVLVSVSVENMTRLWQAFASIFLFAAVAVLLVAFISSSISFRSLTRPLKEMTDVVRRFGMGEFDLRVKETNRKDEVGELSRAFNNMADSIALNEQKRSEFVTNISHELKTPMTTIAGYADGILDGTIPPEREREYLQVISDETRRLARLVRRMLDMSRLQAGGDMVLSQTEFDIGETLAQVLISLEGKINNKGLDVDARLPDSTLLVWGDPDAIAQVCYNLVENAIKFAHPNTVIGVSVSTRGGKAYIAIRDTGETIPEEELPLIFDRLHKSDRSRSLDKEGVGLGLYLVKTILNDLKETITVTSKDNVTEFVFTLTLAR